MKKVELGQTVAILANVGVIAGIAFLAIEIRQNTRMVRSEITKDLFVTSNSKLLEIAADPQLRQSAAAFLDVEDEQLVDHFVMTSIVREFELQFVLRSSGLLDPAIYESYDRAVPVWLSSNASRMWWDNVKDGYNPNFVEYIDGIMGE